jgi:hypothetical protein
MLAELERQQISGEMRMTIKGNRLLLTSLALIGFTTSTALADDWNKEMVLQFSAPVEVPGKVLQPGKYIFRLADSASNRNIVQIFSENDKGHRDFVSTILTVPDYRLATPENPIVLFEERHVGDPEAIKSWFYPGVNTGWHFVYPKSEQLQVATTPTPPTPPPPAPAPPDVAEAAPSQAVGGPATEPELVVIEKETYISQIEDRPVVAEDREPSADRLLPETAGQSAVLLLAGIALLGAGLLAVSLSSRGFQS